MSPPSLIVALDYPAPRLALELREQLAGVVDFFKVGSELFTAGGPEVVEALRRADSRVFLDLKFHDIPNTVSRAIAAAAELGVSIVDVHASGGEAMLKAAMDSACNAGASRPLVFGITVLTHLADEDLPTLGVKAASREQAVRLARLAHRCGLDGVVAAAAEVPDIREATANQLEVLVPGVRPTWASQTHDQTRVATPADAARAGARYIVVGRAITGQPDPRAAALRILEEIESA